MKNILVVKFGALGDVVRTSYLLPALAAAHPDARVYWLTGDSGYQLLRYNPFIYSVVTPGSGYDSLKAIRFDVAFSLDDEADILTKLAALNVSRVVGARLDGSTRTYCDQSACWFDMGLISKLGKEAADALKVRNTRAHHELLGEMAGVRIENSSFFNSSFLERKARSRFANGCFNIGLNSGSGARWPSKQLSVELTADLVRQLMPLQIGGRQVKVWLLGGRDEEARQTAILRACPGCRVEDSGADQSILEFASWIGAMDYLISSDSLALHLGIAQRIPNLSFYAPTSAAEIGTFGTGIKVVSTSPDYCCYRPDADNSTITVDRLMEAFTIHLRELSFPVSTGRNSR